MSAGAGRRSFGVGSATPWGAADYAKDLGRGVWEVQTPSHGGIYVPAEVYAAVHPALRAWAEGWVGGARGWFEEDCCAPVALAVAGPECWRAFGIDAQQLAEWLRSVAHVGRGAANQRTQASAEAIARECEYLAMFVLDLAG